MNKHYYYIIIIIIIKPAKTNLIARKVSCYNFYEQLQAELIFMETR